MLTAKDQDSDKIWGLEAGADDYVTNYIARIATTHKKALIIVLLRRLFFIVLSLKKLQHFHLSKDVYIYSLLKSAF